MASMVETQSARNALRHGLSSDKFIPAHGIEHYYEIRAGLLGIYQPAEPESESIVDELAFCRWKIYEADRILDCSRQAEFPVAADYYHKHQLARFQADLAAFEQSPGTMLDQLLLTLPGTRYILSLWQEAQVVLESGRLFSIDLIKKLVAALGSTWDVNAMTHENLIFTLKCVSISVNPLAFVAFNENYYENEAEILASRRAQHYSAWLDKTDDASTEILAIARAKISELKDRATFLEIHEPIMIQAFAEMHAGYGLLDPTLSRQASRVNRYRMQATNRAALLEYRLIRLQEEKQTKAAANSFSSAPVKVQPKPQNDFLKLVRQNQPTPVSSWVAENDHPATAPNPEASPVHQVKLVEETGELRNESFTPAIISGESDLESVPMTPPLQSREDQADWEDFGDQHLGWAV